MYYYSLKCILYTTEKLELPDDLFSPLPAIPMETTKYLENYKHSSSKAPPLRRRSSQPPVSSTQAHVPPTPIHTVEPHTNHSLEDQVDFRFGPIELISMDVTSNTNGGSSSSNSKKKKKRMNENATHLGYGVLHLYRDLHPLAEQDLPDTKLAKDASLNITSTEDKDTTLCVLAVPSYMTIKDFTDFLGSTNTNIEHYRFIRDFSPNKYTVLLKFKDRQSALACYQKFNGRRFNMTEPEISHVVYIRSNSIESVTISPHTYPYLSETLSQDLETHCTKIDQAELPTCPVCLERMDEGVTGLQHIRCHHTSQCFCIDKWGHNQCPVCRYSEKPVLSKKQQGPYEQFQCECFECKSTESLWICMICGHIGCGRYQEAHAYDHYTETDHLYALEIETQRVWDYLGDGYVHRLIQNTVDGAIVELPSSQMESNASSASTAEAKRSIHADVIAHPTAPTGGSVAVVDDHLGNMGNVNHQGKMDSISADYTYMLTSQMDSQRMYYEEQLEALTTELSSLTSQIKSVKQDIEAARAHKVTLLQRGKELDESIVEVKKEKEKAEKRSLSFKDKYEAMQKNLTEEKLLTKSLVRNNDLLKKDADSKEATLKVLGDQVRDLMFFLEAREKVKEKEGSETTNSSNNKD